MRISDWSSDVCSSDLSWGQSFEVVSGTEAPERGGKAFEPSPGEQVEVGVKYQPAGSNMLLTLAAYKNAPDNVNVIDPEYTPYSIQQGQYASPGLDLEGRWHLEHNFHTERRSRRERGWQSG